MAFSGVRWRKTSIPGDSGPGFTPRQICLIQAREKTESTIEKQLLEIMPSPTKSSRRFPQDNVMRGRGLPVTVIL
jgi:hypothetical protein